MRRWSSEVEGKNSILTHEIQALDILYLTILGGHDASFDILVRARNPSSSVGQLLLDWLNVSNIVP